MLSPGPGPLVLGCVLPPRQGCWSPVPAGSTYGWLSPQRAVPQDTGFSSLFLKVLMQILQWLDSPAVEDGPLQAQLKLFATRYSARRRISDGEHAEGARRVGTAWCYCGGAKPSESHVGLLENS